jgi:3D (Asp-Asp-Asp) domain-containing protein
MRNAFYEAMIMQRTNKSKSLNNKVKNVLLGVLTAIIIVTSVKVQTASAVSIMPIVPTFTTITRSLYDVVKDNGLISLKPEQAPLEAEVVQSVEPVQQSLAVKYTKKYTITAYNSVPWQTDSTPCISADGSDICKLREQGELSCAASLPFGTKINVPGFGVCTVRDRLAAKYSYRIDLYFGGADQIQAAKEWGKRQVVVEVLDS